MREEEAAGRPVSRETSAKLDRYGDLVVDESEHQNLVSRTTIETFRERHILDSLQLLRFVPIGATVCDIGSGAGLPGVVIAATGEHHVTMVEPRKLRAAFLRSVVEELGLDARVIQAKAASTKGSFDVITARAVAPLDELVAMTRHLSHAATTWVFPKGRRVDSELEVLRRSWHCDVLSEPSVTDPEARIVILRNLKPKAGR